MYIYIRRKHLLSYTTYYNALHHIVLKLLKHLLHYIMKLTYANFMLFNQLQRNFNFILVLR